jgi:hypothetical protein
VAIVAFGRNGVGLGHIARVSSMCDALFRLGFKPLLFAERSGSQIVPRSIPVALVPKVAELDREEFTELEKRITSAALLSRPSAVLEDTHPLGFHLDERIDRFLVVRPLTFSALQQLRQDQESLHRRFFIADHPESPTWPYNLEETREISTWQKWKCVGPVYRAAGRRAIAEVRKRYSWSPSRRICVFSLGGGGEHDGADDARTFFEEAEAIARRIRSCDAQAQLVFVRGPLFGDHHPVSSVFQDVAVEPLMPALFAIADMACIRPGFNSTWECISGGTPIVPISGTSYKEPVDERLQKLEEFGLLEKDIESGWMEGKARNDYVQRHAELVCRWPGNAIGDMGADLKGSLGTKISRPISLPAANGTVNTLRELCGAMTIKKQFFLRVDDVLEMDDELKGMLELLKKREVRASLEVIPYLCTFDSSDLARLGLERELFEIGQHGYCHLQRGSLSAGKSEFDLERETPSESELSDLLSGVGFLRKAFRSYFKGGFSPPFDGVPHWLGEAWEQVGGQFVSIMRNLPGRGRIPQVVASVELWDWGAARRRAEESIWRDVHSSVVRIGHAGLVLHKQHFRSREHLKWLDFILSELFAAGFKSVFISDLAVRQADNIRTWEGRAYSSLSRPRPTEIAHL